MPLPLPTRNSRLSLLVEFNPYQILAAEVARPRRGNAVLQSAAEFNRDDVDGLRRWIEAKEIAWNTRATILCGLIPLRGILQRETVEPDRLAEPGYLAELAEEQQKGRFLSATPFKIFKPGAWTLRAVSATDGAALPPSGAARPALICALANNEIVEAQQRLLETRSTRFRIEPGLLSLFGAVYDLRGAARAVVIVVIHENLTAVYILGKEGVHTPNPVLHGLDSIVEMGRKALGVIDEAEVLTELQAGNPELVKHAPKLVRRIARDLKPVIDSFEMTTGQPVEDILCAYLPPVLAWLAEPLAQAIGRTPLAVDCAEWLPGAGLEITEHGPTFGPHWLGALSLVANLPEGSALPAKRRGGDDPAFLRPWHVDCSVPVGSSDVTLAGRRFLTAAIAGTIGLLACAATAWQAYAIHTLRADTRYWEEQMAGNRKLFESVKTASATLHSQSAVLERAYDMMGSPYQLSNLLLDLGRTIPPRMRVDRIEANDDRISLSGALLEPAEEASGTLGRHMEEIRRHADLGPLFSQVSITSLARKADSDVVVFELTLRFKRPAS